MFMENFTQAESFRIIGAGHFLARGEPSLDNFFLAFNESLCSLKASVEQEKGVEILYF